MGRLWTWRLGTLGLSGHRSPLYLLYQRTSLRPITWFYDTWNCQIPSAACVPEACGLHRQPYLRAWRPTGRRNK